MSPACSPSAPATSSGSQTPSTADGRDRWAAGGRRSRCGSRRRPTWRRWRRAPRAGGRSSRRAAACAIGRLEAVDLPGGQLDRRHVAADADTRVDRRAPAQRRQLVGDGAARHRRQEEQRRGGDQPDHDGDEERRSQQARLAEEPKRRPAPGRGSRHVCPGHAAIVDGTLVPRPVMRRSRSPARGCAAGGGPPTASSGRRCRRSGSRRGPSRGAPWPARWPPPSAAARRARG